MTTTTPQQADDLKVNGVHHKTNGVECGTTRLFHIPTLIAKKRDGKRLEDDEIQYLIDAVVDGDIDHAQIGAWLMTVRLRGMDAAEIVQLTRSMANSGVSFDWPCEWRHLVADKHSTGGVGDKISIVLAPALAACGLKVPMISGRGLGHTGGTLDKLESIPGFTVSMTSEQITSTVNDVGCCIVGQTQDIVPADRVLYKTRDVTATVDSEPLIVSSIVSKKAAENLHALVLDVKCGKASTMKTYSEARHLAECLVSTSNGLGIKTTALLTQMDSPIGNMSGNALEVAEAIECLNGGGLRSMNDLTAQLGGHLLCSAGVVKSPQEGAERIFASLADGSAMNKFRLMLQAQGVNDDVIDKLCAENADVFQILPKAADRTDVTVNGNGYIVEIDAMVCADVLTQIGAGRRKADDVIDLSVGLQIRKHVGDRVAIGDVVLTIHHNGRLQNDVVDRLQNAITLQQDPCEFKLLNLVKDVIK